MCFIRSAAVGMAPQDLKYGGEPTETELGDDNTIREGVTISRGTVKGGGITRLGSKNLLMTACTSGTTARWAANAFWPMRRRSRGT